MVTAADLCSVGKKLYALCADGTTQEWRWGGGGGEGLSGSVRGWYSPLTKLLEFHRLFPKIKRLNILFEMNVITWIRDISKFIRDRARSGQM